MSKLNVDQKSIKGLLQDPKADFLIPDYQRPYAWEEKECQTLWDDIFSFAFPDDDYSKFNKDSDEYFLGPIVTFKNEQGKMEVIDGQQRLTTLMLLLRAFYCMYGSMMDKQALSTKQEIEKCIWKTDEFGEPNKNELKIDSQVATDKDKEEFLTILRTGQVVKNQKSKYAETYRFFQDKINDFLHKYAGYFSYLPTRILNNCILLPIEAESQDTALRIFSTLNDRGKPLSDADIFKAQFYKYYTKLGKKDEFIKRWKELEEKVDKIFHPIFGTPMDELFTRYMYYERAKQGITSSTTEALRKFYEKDSYRLLQDENTFSDLQNLAEFWDDISNQDKDRFSDRILRELFVLNYAPNGMWTYFLSVYFMKNKDDEGNLDDNKLFVFLQKTIAFVWAYTVTNPGVNALRTPIYAEMANIVNDIPVTFNNYLFDEEKVNNNFTMFSFYNGRPITKSMLAWWAFFNNSQELLSTDTKFEIEHIYARNRQEQEKSLTDPQNIEMLGNKALLEKRINIRASDYRFSDKIKYYNGFTKSNGEKKDGTNNKELLILAANQTDFTEQNILDRNATIITHFIEYLNANGLIKE